MISRAISILRSLRRSSEFYTDEEREDSGSDITMNESSPTNNLYKDNQIDGSGVEMRNSDLFPHEFNSIQPRASIRMKGIDSMKLPQKHREKLTGKSVERKICQGVGNHHIHDNDDDNDVMIIDEDPQMSKVNKISSQSSRTNNGKKELLCVDDEMPGPLVMDIDDTVHPEEQESNDSQSSYHTSPQEVFDLCEPEMKMCMVNTMEKAEDNSQKKIVPPPDEVIWKVPAPKRAPRSKLSVLLRQQNHRSIQAVGTYPYCGISTTISKKAKTGDKKAETGDKKAETGDKKVKTGDKKVKTGDKKAETGDKKVKTGDKKDKTGDKKVKTGDKKDNTGDKKAKTGEKNVKTGDKKAKTGEKKDKTGDKKAKTGGKVLQKVKNIEDDVIRVRLPIQGNEKKKKLFTLRTSQLLALVSDKCHPLHKWKNIITIENISGLPEKDRRAMGKILTAFLEVKIVTVES